MDSSDDPPESKDGDSEGEESRDLEDGEFSDDDRYDEDYLDLYDGESDIGISGMVADLCRRSFDHSLRPSSCQILGWISEPDDRFGETVDTLGKWMMYYPPHMIDERWDEAVDLFRQSRFPGMCIMR